MLQNNGGRITAGAKRCAAALLVLLSLACTANVPQTAAVQADEGSPAPSVTAASEPTPAPTAAPTSTPEPTPTPAPTPTPVPTPIFVTIGAVGDIMIPRGIVADARTADGTYDFHTLFAPVKDLFGSVDLMCGNLEAPLAGAEARYSTRDDPRPGQFRFNAPDSVLDALKEYGVDVLTTGNNHCLDKGEAGLYRTIETIRAAGFYQTGTYLNAEDREIPCIVDVNGVRVGFVAATRPMNAGPENLGLDAAHFWTIVGRLAQNGEPTESVLRDIARVRENGAEFVILFAHWD